MSEKDEIYQSIYNEAKEAGRKALAACTPTPMVVQEHESPLNDNSPVKQSYWVEGGVCGFAWVNIAPGNCSFALWLKKKGYARRSYYGGVDIWIHEGGQSLERKKEYANAVAKVLKEHWQELRMPDNGYIYPQSRLD